MDFPFVKEAISQLFSKPSTVAYPAVPAPAKPNYRGRIVFHPENCINCNMCERVCAGQAISHVSEPCEGGERITRSFYLGSCTFCSHCASFCTHNAIELSEDYHMVATKEEDLIVSGTYIKKAPVKKPPVKKAAEAPKAEPEADKSAEAKTVTPKTEENAAQKTESAAPAAPSPREDGKPVQDPAKCVYCTLCAKNCPVGALTVDRKAKTWTLNEDACVACGTCQGACPKDAIIM